MPTINYDKRLANLQSRRYDPTLNESIVTKSFSASDIPKDVKYLFESMRPIEPNYNAKTIQAAENVQKHLERELNLHFTRAYRTQGSVCTQTNIKIHSDFDLLTIINKYHYPQTLHTQPYTFSNPDTDIHDLRAQSTKIMKNQYDEVDDTGDKCISIMNKNLNRKVDIVFSYWYNSDNYDRTQDEYYRGVYLYNFPEKVKLKDFPFTTMGNINRKGDQTNDGARKAIRLLKTLRADADVELKIIKGFHINSIVYAIDNYLLLYQNGGEIKIATHLSNELQKLIDDSIYRKSILSPNGLEFPLLSDDTVAELKVLKADLDQLILDAGRDIATSLNLQRRILTY